MNRKIALLLFGMSKMTYQHWSQKKGILEINYMNSYSNYQEYIFEYFQKRGYQVDVYLATNNMSNPDKKELIDTYKPISYSFNRNLKNKIRSRSDKIEKVIDLCLQSQIKYDLVLITRFDLLFKKKFDEININLKRFNLVSELEKKKLICDNFYLFPYTVLKQFSKLVKRKRNVSFHKIKADIHKIKSIQGRFGSGFVSYISNDRKNIGSLSFYSIVRTKIDSKKTIKN